MPTCHQVVQNGESREELNVLEGSSDAQASDLVRGKMIDVMIFESHAPFLRAIESIDAVEDACFSSSVWPDDRKQLSLSDFKTDTRECRDSSEAQPDIVDS